MKKILLFVSVILINIGFSQSKNLVYKQAMSFDVADSLVSPFLCTVDSSQNLWVVSTNSAKPTAMQAIFKAAPNDDSLHLVIAFADSDSVRNITGITSRGNDIYISTRMTAPSGYKSPYYYPYSQVMYFPDGNPQKMIKFKQPNYKDYGTWYTCVSATKDGYLFYGQSYLVTIGTIDGRKSSSKFGFTVDYARVDFGTPMEPGGGLTNPNANDLIRDIAVNPNSDYTDSTSIIYTARSSSSDAGGEGKGGIAAWTGGTESNPVGYRAIRVNDLTGFLDLGISAPYGITVNPSNGLLYVCGTDSSRKWVKGFEVLGTNAVQTDELPSSTSMDIKDTAGAPFIAPSDVAFNSDGSAAYVTDEAANKVFKFGEKTTGVKNTRITRVNSFRLFQNYPNPFNPTTNIVVKISNPSKLVVKVYNTYGEVVKVLADGNFSSGTHIIQFNGENLASGVYICKVSAGNNTRAIKMILLK